VTFPVNGLNVVAPDVRLADAGAVMLPIGSMMALNVWLPVPVLPLAGIVASPNKYRHNLLLTMSTVLMAEEILSGIAINNTMSTKDSEGLSRALLVTDKCFACNHLTQ
jgi:hypothetical protein